MQDVSERYRAEREFHDRAFSEQTRHTADKFYSITARSRSRFQELLLADCRGKRVLELGCGPGLTALPLAEQGASVTGIDISEVAIEQAARAAESKKLKATFLRMNAEETSFDSDTFDLVCGNGILHHLDLKKAYHELARILKPDGSAVFSEPLGHNPLINLYRRLTPSMRTEDEHPLLMRDIELAGSYFRDVEAHYFHLCSLFAVPFRNAPFFAGLLGFLDNVDGFLFRSSPCLGRHAWLVILVMSNPRRES
jgi:SAM-dependent methyltransferase